MPRERSVADASLYDSILIMADHDRGGSAAAATADCRIPGHAERGARRTGG